MVVAENHSVVGGLGEAVARALLQDGVAPKFRHIGLPDEFLDAGALPTLHDRYGISTRRSTRQVKGWLKDMMPSFTSPARAASNQNQTNRED